MIFALTGVKAGRTGDADTTEMCISDRCSDGICPFVCSENSYNEQKKLTFSRRFGENAILLKKPEIGLAFFTIFQYNE